MRTEQEQQLIDKLAHKIDEVTLEDIQAITPEILNSKINDGSYMSEYPVAFVLAICSIGCAILAANNYALALQINTETLNARIQRGRPNAGVSVAFALAYSPDGYAILVADNFNLGLRISAETLNAIIQQGPYGGYSVALALAWAPIGVAILAAHNYTLALRISEATFNAVVKQQGPYTGESVASVLAKTPMFAVINERHRNNNTMLALYSTKVVSRLGKKSAIKSLNKELIDGVLTMLDGRSPQRPGLN